MKETTDQSSVTQEATDLRREYESLDALAYSHQRQADMSQSKLDRFKHIPMANDEQFMADLANKTDNLHAQSTDTNAELDGHLEKSKQFASEHAGELATLAAQQAEAEGVEINGQHGNN